MSEEHDDYEDYKPWIGKPTLIEWLLIISLILTAVASGFFLTWRGQ